MLDNVPIPENPAGLIYGTILIATLLAAEYSRRETYLTTIMVFIMVVITMVFFAVVDYCLGLLLNFVLGIR